MSRSEAAAEAIEEQFGSWEPENATEMDAELRGLPDFFERQAQAFHGMSGRIGGMALPAVTDAMTEAAASLDGVREMFEQVFSTHRQVHDDRLKRLEDPELSDERAWDVQSND